MNKEQIIEQINSMLENSSYELDTGVYEIDTNIADLLFECKDIIKRNEEKNNKIIEKYAKNIEKLYKKGKIDYLRRCNRTVERVLKLCEGKYTQVEYCCPLSNDPKDIKKACYFGYNDTICLDYEEIKKIDPNSEVINYMLLNEEEYNNTILPNTSCSFDEMYDHDDIVLCILIHKPDYKCLGNLKK